MSDQPIKLFKFTSYPDGYKCNRPGNNSGEYVGVVDYGDMESRAESAESSLAAMRQRAEEAEKERDNLKVEQKNYFKDLDYWQIKHADTLQEREIAIARAERAEEDALKMAEGLKTTGDRARRLEELAEYVGSDRILGQLTRIFGVGQPELVELRRLLNALAPEPCGEEG